MHRHDSTSKQVKAGQSTPIRFTMVEEEAAYEIHEFIGLAIHILEQTLLIHSNASSNNT